MTISQLVAAVAHNIGDPLMTKVPYALILNRVNQAQLKICQKLKLLEGTDTCNTVVGTREYSIATDMGITDFMAVRYALWDGYPLRKIDVKDIDEHTNSTGSPSNYYYRAGYIGLHVIPSSIKVLKLYYLKTPTVLSADTDVPDIDSQYHRLIELQATAELTRNPNDWGIYKQEEIECIQFAWNTEDALQLDEPE